MAKLLQPFNATQFDPTQSSTGAFPIGRHPVVAKASEVIPVKNGDGGMLVYDLEVIDGPAVGTVGKYRLNLYNASEKAVEIAHRQFAAMCWSTGLQNVEDSAQVHGIPFIIDVGLQKEPNEHKYTEIKKVFDINGNEPNPKQAPNVVMPSSGPMTACGTPEPAAQAQQSAAASTQAGGAATSWGKTANGGTVANNVPVPDEKPAETKSWGGAGNAQAESKPAAWGQNTNGAPSGGGWGQQR